ALLFTPFIGDIHFDHRLFFESALVACRPNGAKIPRKILAYETLSETNWNAPGLSPAFAPNVYYDISEYLGKKIEALEIFASQMQAFPNERSIEAVKALATLRGATVNCRAAEAFVLIREIL
ncbi:MAG: PIG-L family deacetylase, partial [bacterium]|nr:PIG-L family deacetylase [bacterium]